MACNGTVGRYFESDEDAAGLNEFEAAEVANVLLRAIIEEKLWTHKKIAFWRDSRFGPAVVGIFEDDSLDDELMGKMELNDHEEMTEEDVDYETDGESSGGASEFWRDDDEVMLDEESGDEEQPETENEVKLETEEEEESDVDEENQFKKCETPESAHEENPAAPRELPFQRGGIFPMALRTRAELRPARPDFGYTWFSSRTSY
jgi:hypothetical protein